MNLNSFLQNNETPRLIFCTGAGLSKESGIPTFRDAAGDGLWDNVSVDIVCNIAHFMTHYDAVHEFYNKMRVGLQNFEPNPGHYFIERMQHLYGDDRVIHITANVDDLAERAGGSAMHVHGRLTEVVSPFSVNSEDYEVTDIGYTEFTPTPGIVSKPNIVMFGETFWFDNGVRKPIYNDLYKVLDSANARDTFIIIGSSDSVIPWSVYAGLATASQTVNINPEPHDKDEHFSYNLYSPIGDVLGTLNDYVTARMSTNS